MKKLFEIALSFLLVFTLFGCHPSDEYVETLQKENAQLKADNEEIQARLDHIKKVDLKYTGDFTISIQKICEDVMLDDDQKVLVIVRFFQSDPFLLQLGKDIVSQFKEGQSYTFKFKEKAIDKDIDYRLYENHLYTPDEMLSRVAEHLELVGIAKEDELGLNCNRIKIEVIE